jgi:hypothetical protein
LSSQPSCQCAEARLEVVDGYGRPTGDVVPVRSGWRHDCRYVQARNALIPLAERLADEQVPPPGRSHVAHIWDSAAWDTAFLLAMENLARSARAAGLL